MLCFIHCIKSHDWEQTRILIQKLCVFVLEVTKVYVFVFDIWYFKVLANTKKCVCFLPTKGKNLPHIGDWLKTMFFGVWK